MSAQQIRENKEQPSSSSSSTSSSTLSLTDRKLCAEEKRRDFLPSLYRKTWSTCKRPRRGGKVKIPRRFWGTVFRCVEYPNGVYINNQGSPEVLEEPDDYDSSDFEKLPEDEKDEIREKLERIRTREEREAERDLKEDAMCQKHGYEADGLADPEKLQDDDIDCTYVPEEEEEDDDEEIDTDDEDVDDELSEEEEDEMDELAEWNEDEEEEEDEEALFDADEGEEEENEDGHHSEV